MSNFRNHLQLETFSNPIPSYLRNAAAYSSQETGLMPKEEIGKGVQSMQAGSIALQTYIVSCLKQKDVELEKLKGLSKTQKETREHARYLLNTVVPEINDLYADISGFCNLANNYWDDLIFLAEQIKESKRQTDINDMKIGLEDLKRDVKKRKTRVENAISMFSSARDNLISDNQNLQEVINNSKVLYEGDKGEIKHLIDERDAIDAAIQTNIGIIAGGAVATVVGIVMITVGAVTTIVTGGATIALIGAGILVTGAGVTAMGIAGNDLVKQRAQRRVVVEKLAKLRQEVALLEYIGKEFVLLKNSNEIALVGVENMKQAWLNIEGGLNNLYDSVGEADAQARFLANRLKASRDNFLDVKELVEDSSDRGFLDVQISPDMILPAKVFYSMPFFVTASKSLFPKHLVLSIDEFAATR